MTQYEIRIKPPNELERIFATCEDVQIDEGQRITFKYWNIPEDGTPPGWEFLGPELLSLFEQLAIIPKPGPF